MNMNNILFLFSLDLIDCFAFFARSRFNTYKFRKRFKIYILNLFHLNIRLSCEFVLGMYIRTKKSKRTSATPRFSGRQETKERIAFSCAEDWRAGRGYEDDTDEATRLRGYEDTRIRSLFGLGLTMIMAH
jgi:hypothetical protein